MSIRSPERGFGTVSLVPDGTRRLLEALAEYPAADVRCSLGHEPAAAVFYTPGGCAARPGDKIQALCPQHVVTDGVSAGTRLLLDLSEGERWSRDGECSAELPLRLGYTTEKLLGYLAALPEQI
jgi:hypothetical protein